jgi:hypothetical protein
MTYDPYAPPAIGHIHSSDAHRSGALGADGALAVWVGDTLPDVCLKCGASHGLERRRLLIRRRPFWVYGLLFAGLITFFLVDASLPKGWISGCLCRGCLGRYGAALWARWVIAFPVVAWFLTLFTLSAIGADDTLGGVIVFTLFLQVAVLFTVFAWLVQKFFVAPRVLDLVGMTGLDVRGLGMRVAGIHPQAAAAYLAAASWSAHAPSAHAHAAPPAHPFVPPSPQVAEPAPVVVASPTLVSPTATLRDDGGTPEPPKPAVDVTAKPMAAPTLVAAAPTLVAAAPTVVAAAPMLVGAPPTVVVAPPTLAAAAATLVTPPPDEPS